MRKPTLLLCFLLFIFTKTNAQNYILNWARNIGELSDNYGYEVVSDNNENTYVSGTFTTTQDFGGVTLTALPPADFFIAKYDSLGQLLWVNQGGGSSTWYEEGRSIVVDEMENVYVTGSFYGTADFDGNTLESYGEYDAFVAKYDIDGNLIWVNQIGGSTTDLGKELALDNDGNLICLTGSQSAYVIFDINTVLQNGNLNGSLYVSKFSPNGNLLWANEIVNNVFHNLNGFEIDSNNNIVIAGTVIFNASFQGTSFNTVGFLDAFLAKYDPQGNLVWLEQGGGPLDIVCNSLCLDANDNIYLTGDFKGAANFDGISVQSNGEQDVFISKYDPNGIAVFTISVGDENRDEAFDIDYSTNDELFIVGRFQDSLIFDDEILQSNGAWDIFTARYDINGNFIQAENYGGDGNTYFDDRVWGIDVSPNNSVAITGNFSGEMNLGTDTLIANGQHDLYIVKWKIEEIIDTETSEIVSPKLHLFPNPTNNNISISTDNYSKVRVDITTIDGKLLNSHYFFNNELIQISLPDLSGTYIVSIQMDELDKISGQVIKE